MTTKTLDQVLRETKELLADGSKWTQFAYARTAAGSTRDPWAKDAVCFCLSGAIEYECGIDRDSQRWEGLCEQARKVVSVAGDKLGYTQGGGLIFVNDQLGHDAVMKVLDYSIEHCEELAKFGKYILGS